MSVRELLGNIQYDQDIANDIWYIVAVGNFYDNKKGIFDRA